MLAELLEGMNEKKHAGFSNEASSPMLIKSVILDTSASYFEMKEITLADTIAQLLLVENIT